MQLMLLVFGVGVFVALLRGIHDARNTEGRVPFWTRPCFFLLVGGFVFIYTLMTVFFFTICHHACLSGWDFLKALGACGSALSLLLGLIPFFVALVWTVISLFIEPQTMPIVEG